MSWFSKLYNICFYLLFSIVKVCGFQVNYLPFLLSLPLLSYLHTTLHPGTVYEPMEIAVA